MKQLHKYHKEMVAYNQGYQIEYLEDDGTEAWFPMQNPVWDDGTIYRVAPCKLDSAVDVTHKE